MNKLWNMLLISFQLFAPLVIGWLICFKFQIELVFSELNLHIGTVSLNNDWIAPITVKIIIYFLFTTCSYLYIRNQNEKKILFHSGDYYKDYPYFVYWVCSVLLNYRKCTLKNVPVYLQFKLLLNNLFMDYYTSDNSDELQNEAKYVKDTFKSSVKVINKNQNATAVNLILIDTYMINDDQLPKNIFNEYSIYIKRATKPDGIRKFNQNYIDQIKKEITKLDTDITRINIYATTNPKHNKSIVQDIFSLGNRTSIKHICVAKQEKRTFVFSELVKVK